MSAPAYSAATLVYGVMVDAKSLIWAARVWRDHRPSWSLLTALIEGRISCSHSLSTTGVCSISDLPNEILNRVKSHVWSATRPDAECEAWLLFGDEGVERYHPTYCCEAWKTDRADWPGTVAQTFDSAWDEFRDHFSFAVPRCENPCGGHFLCRIIHDYLKDWELCLADCAFEIDGDHSPRPTDWIVTSSNPEKAQDIPLFSHHLSLDTDSIENEQFRKVKVVEDNWQEKEKSRRESLVRFLKDSGVEQPLGTKVARGPQFYLVCIAQQNV